MHATKKKSRATIVACLVALAFIPVVKAADSVERWNAVMCDFSAGLPDGGLPPFLEVRIYAMVHIAILDAVKTATKPGNSEVTNVDAAVAAAAHDVLVNQLPFAAGLFDGIYSSELEAIPSGAAKNNGIAIGHAAAASMIASRADEDPFGALEVPYTPGSNPGDYQPTPPLNFVAGAGWPQIRTFVVKSSSQFRSGPNYSSLSSLEYAMDVNEIAGLGKSDPSGRTGDQTAIAQFWYENSSFAWNRVARDLAAGRSLLEHARLFAALNAAITDAYSTSLESKFHYNFWRPITAIRAADTDDNPLTVVDPAWEPLSVTHPVPDYPSAHAAAGGAASTVIIAFLGDDHEFSHTSTSTGTLPPEAATRTYLTVSEAAIENAYSRMLVGIHFRRACTAGLEQGKTIGQYVVEKAKFLNNYTGRLRPIERRGRRSTGPVCLAVSPPG